MLEPGQGQGGSSPRNHLIKGRNRGATSMADVIEAAAEVPVNPSISWATWCGPCKTLADARGRE